MTTRAARLPAVLTVLLGAVILALLPVRAHELGPTTSFLPAVLALVAAADVFSAYLLCRDYASGGDRRLLLMAAAYVWSLVVLAGYAAAFPGVLSAHPRLATAPSVAPWLYVLWHVGFPVLLALAWLPGSRWLTAPSTPRQRGREARAVLLGCAALAGGVVAAVVQLGASLPVLITGVDTSRMTALTAPVGLPLVVAAVAVTAHGVRGRTGPERWTVVTVAVCLADLVLTYSSRYRYSVGWYCGRTLTVAAAATVLLAMLHESTRLQARLREALDQHRVVLETLNEGVTVHDSTGVLQANLAARQLLDVTDGPVQGRTFDVVHEDGTPWDPHDRPTADTLATGVPHRDVLLGLRLPDQQVRWLSVSTALLPGREGREPQVVAGFMDVTEREQQRRDLEASRDAALGAVAAKSAFLANVSHEIRTPLNGVLGLTDLLLDGELSASQRDLAQTAQDCGRALLALLNDVLDFSKVEAGQVQLAQEPFALRALAADAVALVRGTAATKGLAVELAVHEDVPDGLVGDALRLRQVLTNLLSNAVKFTDAGSVRFDIARHEGGLRLAVSDTGCGLPDGPLEELFEPYRQADASTARRHGGTGLGLAIVRQLVGAMGGSVGAQRRTEGGSRFWLELQLPEHASPAPPAPPAPPSPDPLVPLQGTVLVAEDNAVNALVIEMLLSSWGLSVSRVGDGAAAVECGGLYDLVLMDAQLPVLDGVSATRLLRERLGEHGPAVLALSASARAEDRAGFLAAGAVGYLTTPVVPELVHAAVAAALAELPRARRPVG